VSRLGISSSVSSGIFNFLTFKNNEKATSPFTVCSTCFFWAENGALFLETEDVGGEMVSEIDF
jgi:hypothetical protein